MLSVLDHRVLPVSMPSIDVVGCGVPLWPPTPVGVRHCGTVVRDYPRSFELLVALGGYILKLGTPGHYVALTAERNHAHHIHITFPLHS